MLRVAGGELFGLRPGEDELVGRFHDLRRAVFADQQARGKPIVMDLDGPEFDSRDAVYGMWCDPPEAAPISVRGGFRLLPTLKPHPLARLFPRAPAVLRAEDVFEISRIYVAPQEKQTRGRITTGIVVGLAELAVAMGIEVLCYVVDSAMLTDAIAAGWIVNLIGDPHNCGDGVILHAGWSPIGRDFRERLVQRTGWKGPALSAQVLDRLVKGSAA